MGIFFTEIKKRISVKLAANGIIVTDKDDICIRQLVIVDAGQQGIHIELCMAAANINGSLMVNS